MNTTNKHTTNQEKVSIVVPIYKVERYLPECIESILAQTYKNIEILLVNDGSPDGCGKICDEYALQDSRIVVVHQSNGGVTSARRSGVERASGEWVCFVDGDDGIPAHAVETLLKASEGVDCVRGTCFTDRVLRFPTHTLSVFTPETYIKSVLEARFLPTLWGGIYRKELFHEGVFDISPEIKHSQDTLSLLELVQKLDKARYIDEVVYNYTPRPTSTTRTFVFTHAYALKYDDYLMKIFQKKEDLEKYDEQLLKRRIATLIPLMDSPTMKAGSEYVKRIRREHHNTPKSIGQHTTLLLGGMSYTVRKPLYALYAKMNDAAFKRRKKRRKS